MLVDDIDITVKAGHGGRGLVSFGKMAKSGPDGGNGGRGGDLYIKGVTDIFALNAFKDNELVVAEDGLPGGQSKRTGKSGDDLILSIPLGTALINKETGEVIEVTQKDAQILLVKGGKGGKGNWEFRSGRNVAPTRSQPGLDGEEKSFKLILKLIADFGLVGIPSAGKSSLLNELTAAKAEVGAYPFTTLEPNLGVLGSKVVADIPGLIEGASQGKGLGIKFLKHIEKVTLILHCIAADSADVEKDYKTIVKELEEFNPTLREKKEIILLTKSDLVDKKGLAAKTKLLKKYSKTVIPVSIHDFESIEALKVLLTR
ncbi:MAG: GTPase ObgE [bacterium]|nr:GTPase ObgE [bacterium]